MKNGYSSPLLKLPEASKDPVSRDNWPGRSLGARRARRLPRNVGNIHGEAGLWLGTRSLPFSCWTASTRVGRPGCTVSEISFFPCVSLARFPATLLETGQSWQQEKKDKSGSCCSKEAFGVIFMKGWGSREGGGPGSNFASCPDV